MTPAENSCEVDKTVFQAVSAGDFGGAATCVLRAYGPEMLSFLRARLCSAHDGDEAYSVLAEDLWKGLPGFGFRCSVRTWLYTLARHAVYRQANSRKYHEALDTSRLPPPARTSTKHHQRTDVKQRIRELRRYLSPEDQTILILHVDRGLCFRDLAIVMHEQAITPHEPTLAREAARLRKRFERIKLELRKLAIVKGVLPS